MPIPTNDEIKEILTLAYEFGFKGFGGRCASAAMAINRVLFQGQGTFILACNDALWSSNKHFAGHIVVEYGGTYWDADARPKTREDIDDWGDLSGDSYYTEVAKQYKIRWTKKRATETSLFATDDESEIPFGHDEADELSAILEKALMAFNEKKGA